MPLAVHVNRLGEWSDLRGLREDVRRAVTAATAATEISGRGEVSVTFLPDHEMRSLNRQWLGRDRTTDVIAFQLGSPEDLLADIYVGPEAAKRSARELGLSVREEVLRLVVHGTLHALGYDHPEETGREESEMVRLQEELLRALLDD